MESTKENYSVQGQYTSERQKLHDQIVEELSAGYRAASDPLVIYLGGGTASGKSTLSKMLVQSFLDEGESVIVIDSDEIKQKLPEYQDWLRRDANRAASIVHDESSDIANQLYDRCIAKNLNMIYDGTMKSAEKYNRLITVAKQNGYSVSAVLADVPLNEALRRAEIRFQIEQRRVPDEVIRESHELVPATFHQLKDRLDSFYLYDTSKRYPIQFLVKEDDKVHVLDSERLQQFYSKSGMAYEDWIELPVPEKLKDVLKRAQGIPTSPNVTPQLLNEKVGAYRLHRQQGKETIHFKKIDGQLGSVSLEKVPFLSIKERNLLLDQASQLALQPIKTMDYTQ